MNWKKNSKEEFADMQFLAEEKEKIGNPDNLGNVIMDVVWEQFLNQIAVNAGEDFIKENRDLHLDLRKDAHIQTTENFANGKIATHNTEIDYQKRYSDWQANFEKDENGNVVAGNVMPLTIAFDHRAFDLGDVKPFMEKLNEIFLNPEVIKEWL